MRIILLMISLLSLLHLSAQDNNSSKSLTTGFIDSVYSNVLKEKRTLLIYVPQPEDTLMAKKSYPVLYLLSGENYFMSVVSEMKYLSSTFGNDAYPEMIVVGIVSSENINDFLPKLSDNQNEQLKNLGKDNFTLFLERELLPFINKKYPTSPYRILFGHSLAGLRTVNTLVYSPEIFNAYIALDPSLGHDYNKWINQAEIDVTEKKYKSKSLFIGMAHTMPQMMDTSAIQKDTTGNSRHMRSIISFTEKLKSLNQNGFSFASKYYPNETHGSVPIVANYDALHFIFSGYSFKYFKEIAGLSLDSSKKFVETHYAKVSTKMGYKVSPPESVIRNLANYLLSKNQKEKATYFFELNAKNYPTSYLALVELGDLYSANNKIKEAIEIYENALKIFKSDEIEKKLNKLLLVQKK